MTQVISKTGQRNTRFGAWNIDTAYRQGDTVIYEGQIYSANQDIAADTSFIEGTVGATWLLVVEGGGTASEIGAGTPGNVIVDANGIVTISAAGTANVVTVDANGMSIIGNLTLTGPEALNIPGSPGEGSILTTDANGKFEWSSLADAVGNSIAMDGLTTTGNITTTGTITSNTITATGNITSNATISGNAVQGNTGDFGTLTVTSGANLGSVANLTIFGGNAGEFLQTDGNGVLTWAVGGSSNGNSGITTNTSNVTMTVEGNTIQIIDVNGTTTTGNANVTGNITATETITGNTIVSNVANIVALNITGDANLGDAGNLTILGGNAGEVLTTDGTGNVYWAASGTSNGGSGITTNTSNVTLEIGGNTIQIIDANGTSTTGNANISGNTNVAGNIIGGNITSNGTVSGNVIQGNTANFSGNITSNGTVSGNVIQGNTATITGNVSAGNITSNGTVTSNALVANTITGGNISGNGAGLTNITGANVVGNVPSAVLANFANFAGNITVAAQPNITSVGTLVGLSIGGDIIPDADEVYDIGNATHKFRDLWLSGSTLRLGNSSLSSANGNIIMSSIRANSVNTVDLTATGTSTLNTVTANTVTSNLFTGNGSALSNINGANVIGTVPVANFANFAGNVTVNAQPNITSLGTLTSLTVTGVSTLGANANVKITGGTTGQLLATDGSGNLIWTTVSTSGASNGTSGTQVNAGNVTTVIGGTVIEVIDANGTTITGNANVSGNITAGGNITGGNITTTGTVSGNVIQGNVITGNTANIAGNVTAGNVTTTGTVTANVITGNTANIAGNVTAGNVTTTGTVTANLFIGNGSQLTNINGANITGTVANANFAAYAGNITIAGQANITSVGTLTSLTVSGNSALGSNANVRITGGTAGQALFTDGAGNLNWTTVTANAIFNGNSNVSVPAAGGNVNISAAGNANVVVVTGNGLRVTGTTTLSNTLTIAAGGAQITGDMSLNGNFNVIGNVNYNNVSQLVIGDPLLFIASNNATDVVDSGLVSTYNSNKYTGIARNRLTNTWTVFNNLNTIPTSTIDWANAPLGSFAAGNTTVTGFAANGLVTLGTVANVRINGGSAGQLLSTDGTGTLSWVAVSGGANFISNGVSNLQFTGSGGNLIGAVDGSANSFFLSPIVFSAKSLSVLLGAGNASTMTSGVDYRVAVGYQAGDSSQATNTVAIGNAAGKSSQAANAVAIGTSAGQTSQLTGAIAIGSGAGRISQGANAVAIGQNAGATNQHANTIILNASGANLDSVQANSFLVSSVRNDTAANVVFYNPTTKEVTYGSSAALSPTSIVNGTSNIGIPVADGGIVAFVGTNPAINIPGGFDGTTLIGISANGRSRTTSVGWSAGGGSGGSSANSVFVGYQAGALWTASNIVAIGHLVAGGTVATGVIVIGHEASFNTNLGANSIIIGTKALSSAAQPGTIVLNATGIGLSPTAAANSFYVDPIRNDTGNVTNYMFYNTTTKEVTYSVAPAAVPTSIVNGTSNISIATLNGNIEFKVNNNANVAFFSATGANFSGTANVVGNLSAGNITTRIVQASAIQVSLSITANGHINANGNITGENITGRYNGDGGNLSNIQGVNITGNVASAITANFANFAGNITVNAQPNITSVGTLTSLTVSGNVTGGNLVTTGTVTTANLNATGANVSLGAVGNVKIAGGTSGQYLQTNGSGNLTWATVSLGAASNISNGTSNVSIDTLDGNVAVKVNGTTNVAVFSATGANFSGTANVVGNLSAGNITTQFVQASVILANIGISTNGDINATANIYGGNILGRHYGDGGNLSNIQGANVTGNVTSAITANFANFAGNITIAAQPNITSVGTLTSLAVSGNINATGANVSLGAVGNVKITGGTTGQYLQTNGSGDLTWATVASSGTPNGIANGTTFLTIASSNGDITGNIDGSTAVKIAPAQVLIGRFGAVSGVGAIAIGQAAFADAHTVAIGHNAGVGSNIAADCVFIGTDAGSLNTRSNSVCIGTSTGGSAQAGNLTMIGTLNTLANVVNNIVVIGHRAIGNTSSANNYIVLNARHSQLVPATSNSFFVDPIRNATAANTVFYDPTTKEVTYGLATAPVPTSLVNGTSNVVVAPSGSITIGAGGQAARMIVAQNGTTVTGGLSVETASAAFLAVNERVLNVTGATGVVLTDGSFRIFNYTSVAGNFTPNLAGFSTGNWSASSSTISVVTLIINQGLVPYMPTGLQIDGVAQTIRWQGGVTPAGIGNKVNVVAFTIMKISATPTYLVMGQMVSFG